MIELAGTRTLREHLCVCPGCGLAIAVPCAGEIVADVRVVLPKSLGLRRQMTNKELIEELNNMAGWTLPEGTPGQQRIIEEYQRVVSAAASALSTAEARIALADELAETVPQLLYAVMPTRDAKCPCGKHDSDKAHIVEWLAKARKALGNFRIGIVECLNCGHLVEPYQVVCHVEMGGPGFECGCRTPRHVSLDQVRQSQNSRTATATQGQDTPRTFPTESPSGEGPTQSTRVVGVPCPHCGLDIARRNTIAAYRASEEK